jgi:hypothetical protein
MRERVFPKCGELFVLHVAAPDTCFCFCQDAQSNVRFFLFQLLQFQGMALTHETSLCDHVVMMRAGAKSKRRHWQGCIVARTRHHGITSLGFVSFSAHSSLRTRSPLKRHFVVLISEEGMSRA